MELITNSAVEATCLRSSKRRKTDGDDHHDSVVICPHEDALPTTDPDASSSSSELGFPASSCSSGLQIGSVGELRSLPVPLIVDVLSKRADHNSVADGLLLSGSFSTEKSTPISIESESKSKTRKHQMELPPPPPKKPKPSEIRRDLPSAKMPPIEEIDSFFSAIEMFEKKRFSEKYNFDVAKDVPLEGRYQWVQIKP